MAFNPNDLGRDLVIGQNGDLVVFGNDLDYINGVDHVILRFSRELMSPHGILSRYTLDSSGLVALDDNYGNEAFYQLSEPMNEAWVEGVKSAIHTVGNEQPNLTISKIDYYLLDVGRNRLGFDIQLQVDGGPISRLYLESNTLGFNVRVIDGNRT